jgi:hypothetical protein
VLKAAIGQLMPTADDTHVVEYLDRLLASFDVRPVRVADLRDLYTNGIALLDQLAGGDFAAMPPLQHGLLISHAQAAPFAALLFDDIVEALYAPPGEPGHRLRPRHVTGSDDTPTSFAMA